MSADAWEDCPFCSKKYKDKISELEMQLKEKYETMTAKDYDVFKSEIAVKIHEINEAKKEKSLLRIDGIYNYSFDRNGDFSIRVGAYCPTCKREWNAEGTAKPTIGT